MFYYYMGLHIIKYIDIFFITITHTFPNLTGLSSLLISNKSFYNVRDFIGPNLFNRS